MSLRLETRNLSKRFGECTAVSDVSLRIEPGTIHAVLGENGAGKSTLMKLLFGLHQPSEGQIFLDEKPVHWHSPIEAIHRGLGMVQQHFSLVETLSAIDNIILGAEICGPLGKLDRNAAIAHLEKRIPGESLAVPWLTPVAQLSVGQKQRVEILKLLFRDSRILFLDEPTAVLAPTEIDEFFAVLRKLKTDGRTIVLITHKINEVLAVCDSYSVLRQGKLVASGNVSEATADTIIESMVGRRIAPILTEKKSPGAGLTLNCREMREDSQERGALRSVTLHVRSGEIVGIAGVEGSGQSRLVEAVMGLREFSGDLELFGTKIEPLQTKIVRDLGIGLIPEDRHQQGLWLGESCSTNMIIGLEDKFLRHHIFRQNEIDTKTSGWAKAYDVRSPSLEIDVARLSGGNQQKVLFAREVEGRQPKLLLCHQPTRGVDLGAIDLIHRKLLGLRTEGVGILVLSSELDELFTLCDRLYVFFEGQVVAEFAREKFDHFQIGLAMTGVKNA